MHVILSLTVAHCAECGAWQINKDIFGYNLEGLESELQPSGEACIVRCQELPGCNAAVFKKYNKQCWPKQIPTEGMWAEPLDLAESDFILLCPDQVVSESTSSASSAGMRSQGAILATTDDKDEGSGEGLSVIALVGIAVAAVVVLAAVVVVFLRATRQRSQASKHIAQQVLSLTLCMHVSQC